MTLDETMTDGTPYTPWQRAVIAGWHRRNPTPRITLTGRAFVPWGVYCLDCRSPSVCIPADATAPRGYTICPQCTERLVAGRSETKAEPPPPSGLEAL